VAVASLLAAAAAIASTAAPSFEECRVPVVNRWSERIESLWEDWLTVRRAVDEIPTVIGEAAGEDLRDLDAVIALVGQRQMPLYVDDTAYRFVVPLDTDDGSQGRLTVALQTTVKGMESVRSSAAEVDARRRRLVELLRTHRPLLAVEFAGHPMDAAVEVPRADALVQAQLESLDALGADIERCLTAVERFFLDLTAASSHGSNPSPHDSPG